MLIPSVLVEWKIDEMLSRIGGNGVDSLRTRLLR